MSLGENQVFLAAENSFPLKVMAKLLTKRMVNGYSRDISGLYVPEELLIIIEKFVDNFVDIGGNYEWQISDAILINKILTAKCGDKFESEWFIVSHLKCKLRIFPNGDKPELKGYFIIHLFIDLPDYIETITFSRIFRVRENHAASPWLSVVSNGDYEYWTKQCPLSELIKLNPDTITVDIQLNIQQIVLKDDIYLDLLKHCKLPVIERHIAMKTHIDYCIDTDVLKMFIDDQPSVKPLCSDIVDNMWCIEMFTDENRTDYVDVYVGLCGLPQHMKSLDVRYVMKCDAVNDEEEEEYTYDYTYTIDSHSWGAESWFTLDTIRNVHSLRFTVDLEIKDIEYNEADLCEICEPSKILYLLS